MTLTYEDDQIRVKIDKMSCITIENVKSGVKLAIMTEGEDLVTSYKYTCTVYEDVHNTLRFSPK